MGTKPVKDSIQETRLSNGIDFLTYIIQRNIEPLHPKALGPRVVLPQGIQIVDAVEVKLSIRTEAGINAETEQNAALLTQANHFLKSRPFFDGERTIPKVHAFVRLVGSVRSEFPERTIIIHKKIEPISGHHWNLTEVLIW